MVIIQAWQQQAGLEALASQRAQEELDAAKEAAKVQYAEINKLQQETIHTNEPECAAMGRLIEEYIK